MPNTTKPALEASLKKILPHKPLVIEKKATENADERNWNVYEIRETK